MLKSGFHMFTMHSKRRAAAWAAAVALGSLAGAAAAQDQLVPVVVEPVVGRDVTYRYVLESQQPELPTSDYWIGVQMATPWLPDLAKEQLGLEHGLLVMEAMPDSPAAKAGIKKNDILLRTGDKDLKEPPDLVKAVDEAKESELRLTILRGGKEQTIRLTPVKRDESKAAAEESVILARLAAALRATPQPELRKQMQEDIRRLEDALNRLKAKAGEAGAEIVIARPAIVTGRHTISLSAFPKDLLVRITKDGDKPVKVYVKRGDQEWEVADDKLDELPEDVRRHVVTFLGRELTTLRLKVAPPVATGGYAVRPDGTLYGYEAPTAPAAPVPPTAPGAPTAPRQPTYRVPTAVAPAATEAKLDAILKRLELMESRSLEQLQREVEKLRKELDEVRAVKPESADKP